MAEFTYRPTYQVELDTQPKVLEAAFGDGYTQRTPAGINHMLETWSLTFANLPDSIALAIDTFLRARGGYETFTWRTPRDATVTSKLYICKQWKTTFRDEDQSTVTATFEQQAG
jgi:phage-related protein